MADDVMELPCPHCGEIQRILEAHVPPSGEVACAACGEAISFRTNPRSVTGAFRVPRSPLPPPPSVLTHAEMLLRMEEWDPTGPPRSAAPAPANAMVCCPACGHTFDAATATAAPVTILVVEDTDFFLHLATETLSRRYQTVGVRTAAEAREVLATRPIQLVVLDLTLPDAEGTAVLRALPRGDIPVLIYTSRDETSLLGEPWEGLQALGARDVVHKGINIEDTLLQKVDELLGQPASAGLG